MPKISKLLFLFDIFNILHHVIKLNFLFELRRVKSVIKCECSANDVAGYEEVHPDRQLVRFEVLGVHVFRQAAGDLIRTYAEYAVHEPLFRKPKPLSALAMTLKSFQIQNSERKIAENKK